MALITELLVWWLALSALWLMVISTVDLLEVLVGSVCALAAAVVAVATRRAVTDR
ncbi:hypothetical protein [Streptomyces kaempferi]|uniref:Uncharacterized protein n=1 Tax=Streptomyces kaempferi TaxID=333725 RepID=A0ABW3XMT2_9ACTN